LFILWCCDKSPAASFADTQKTLSFFHISDAIENVKPYFKPVPLSAMRAKLCWHLSTPFFVSAFLHLLSQYFIGCFLSHKMV
jgi:hypothetical protein